jgi:hypothetical protein
MKGGLPNSDLVCGKSEFATPFMRSSETRFSYVKTAIAIYHAPKRFTSGLDFGILPICLLFFDRK